MNKRITGRALLVAIVSALLSRSALAQKPPPMGVPLPTTIVIAKPAPGQLFGDQQVITVGVQDKVYKFILKDAYVDSRVFHWPDIWAQVQQLRPNLIAQGADAGQFAKIQPGQTVTIKGMYAPPDRTFEVVSVEQGGGEPSGGQHY